MLMSLLIAAALLQVAPAVQPSPKPAMTPAAQTTAKGSDSSTVTLLNVKRIYVESFGDDVISKELQAMVVSSLVATKRFKVTENRDRSDAVLKGVALEKSSQELHAYGESTAVGVASGGTHGEVSGSVVNGNGTISGSSGGGFIARHMGTTDSSANTETINEARVAVRLVNSDGDVIWTTTQESKGAKYKGAGADVADMCVKQLLRDVEKLEGERKSPTAQPPSVPNSQH